MELLATTLKYLLLLAPPVATLIAVQKAQSYWPIAFATFVGTTITAINLRIAGQLTDLANTKSLEATWITGSLFRLSAWLICPLLLGLGLRKLYQIRISRAKEELFAEED